MKKILSYTVAVLFTASSFAQSNSSAPATKAVAKQTDKTNSTAAKPSAQSKERSPEDKAKQFTDQINNVVQLRKEIYDKVLQANLEFQKKKAVIMGGKSMKDMDDDQKVKIKELSAIRRTRLKEIMGKDLYAKWEASRKPANPSAKGAKPAAAEADDDK